MTIDKEKKMVSRYMLLLIIAVTFISISQGKAQDFDLMYESIPSTDKEYEAFVLKNAPSEDAFVAVQRLAERFIKKKQWEKAAKIFENFQPKFPNMKERFDKIIDLLQESEEGLKIIDLGKGINSRSGEYNPTPTSNGKLIYFTRRAYKSDEDIYVSELGSNKKWQEAKKVQGDNINTKSNEAVMSISEDGQKLILFGNYKGSYERGDIFWSDKDYLGNWGRPHHFPWPINTNYFDSDGQLVAGDQVLIFVSDRPGGLGKPHFKGKKFHGDKSGNVDIYVCIKSDDGLWSEPINLGPTINTPYAERFPFLHPDGKTLYFCSDGHYGLGRSDVFMSKRLNEDSWTEWSEPINLGKEVNTPDKEFNFIVSTDGRFAYLANGVQPEVFDIFTKELPSGMEPEYVPMMYGLVMDNGKNPLGGHIEIHELGTNKIREADSDHENGNFFFPLQFGKKYKYTVTQKNYEANGGEIDLSGIEPKPDFIVRDTVYLKTRIDPDDPNLNIGDILFKSGSDKVDPRSFPELDRLSQILVEHPELKLEISAHTDSIGSDKFNQKLSERRAKSIVNYVISKGVEKENLQPAGYGESRPVAPNSTEEGRALNRRVECTVLGADEEEDEDEE